MLLRLLLKLGYWIPGILSLIASINIFWTVLHNLNGSHGVMWYLSIFSLLVAFLLLISSFILMPPTCKLIEIISGKNLANIKERIAEGLAESLHKFFY